MVNCKEQESEMLLLLKSLKLKHLPQLDYISKRDPLGFTYISQLSILHVHDCDNLIYLFPHSMMKCMLQLQELDIRRCKMMSMIVVDEKGQGKSSVDKIEFTQLKILQLYDLPNLVSFSPEVIATSATSTKRLQNVMQTLFNEKVALPSLEELELKDLDNLEGLGHIPISMGSFYILRKVHVHDCDNLRYLFPHSMMKFMLQLQELDIRRCKMMSRIVADEKGQCKSSVDKIEFTELKFLRLYDLPNLVSFFPTVIATSATSTEHLQNVMQTLFNEKVVFPTLEVLELEHLDNLEGMGHYPPSSMSLSKLRYVHVRHCGKLIKFFQAQLLSRLQNLQYLSIKDCSLLEKVVDCTEQNSKIFPLLKSLKLESLPQLNHISERDYIGFMYIPQSSILHIDGCDNLRFLFTQSMTQCILQLQELEIGRCKMMSAIVREEDNQGEILVDNIEFTQLKILQLYDLQNLVSIFPKVTSTVASSSEHTQNPGQRLFNEKVAFPSLEELELHGLQNMNEIWCNQLQTGSFNKLIELHVSDCGSLRNMFSPFMARHLVHLKRLVIIKCSMMEEVVAKEEDEEERINKTPLPKLEYLELNDLSKLKSFCHVTHDWELPLVAHITVLNCPKMKTFSPGVICTPKLQRVFVKEGMDKLYPGKKGEDWLWISDLNQTILHLIKKHKVRRRSKRRQRD